MATNPITVTVSRLRSGSSDRPIATPAKETIAFRGIDIPAGTSIALLSCDGLTTLAHTVSTDAPNEATLDTATIEAFAAAPLNPQHTAPATLVIGTPDELIAAIPVTLVRNPLESITPPTESAPTYPTSEDLAQILAQITAASDAAKAAASAAEKSAQDAEEALRRTAAAAQDALTSVASAKTAALADIETAADGAVTDIANAAKDLRDEISADRERAETAADTAAAAAAEAAAKAALVPAVAVDAEAALQASRNLIGTSGIQLVSLSGTI